MKEKHFTPTAILLLLVLAAGIATPVAALDDRYKCNGEVYLLVGKGSTVPGTGEIDYRGIWRLNDPQGFFSGAFPQYLIGQVDIQDMAVDLNRNIFTLTDPNPTVIGSSYKIKRQVLDTDATANISDRGCHAYIHMDHRGSYWGFATNVYRTGPVGRNIRANSGGSWAGFKSAGPGNPTTEPPNPTLYLPKYTNAKLQLDYYPGKPWYEIPNGAWYSSWRWVKGCGWFYQVFADQVSGTQYDWYLDKWNPNTAATSYTKQAGDLFSTTYDMTLKRATLAGCLDGCGGASGNETIKSDKIIFSVAFMPTVDAAGNAISRAYSYSRSDGKSNGAITAKTPYQLVGDLNGYGSEAPDTQWVGVSMKDATTDYLYSLGNSVIKNWVTAGGGSSTGIKISAVAVSNQWSQKGGIVFAFDEKEKMVYKFERDEKGGTHNNTAFSIKATLDAIGAASTASIDDIKADGDGNMFIGLTFPGTHLTTALVTKGWDNSKAYMYETSGLVNDEGLQEGTLIFKQDFRKSVFRISAMGEPPREEGGRVFATQVYERKLLISPSGWDEITAAGPMPNLTIETIVASWTKAASSSIGPFTPKDGVTVDRDLGKCRVAVINVPKPPTVLSLSDKKSFLDIIGAYKDKIPAYDPTTRSTAQNSQTRFSSPLSTRALYFFMVENYPIPTGAQNPTVEPDNDGDGRSGGFISTIKNPNPSTDTTSSGTIRYYWRTWLVEDQYGNPVCPPESMSDLEAGSYFHWFYTPIRGKYIITCRSDYDWYDYDQISYGTTIDQFLANPGAANKKNTKAVPSKDGMTHDLSSSRLSGIMGTADFAFMAASASVYLGQILGSSDNTNFFAIEPVVVAGETPLPITDPKEIARVQRCDKNGNNAETESNWHPKTGMDPAEGFHGIRVGTEYHWRMDLASQAIFFQDIDPSKCDSTKLTQTQANYNLLANKLTNSKETAYFVNADPEFQFDRTGNDIRWGTGEPAIEAYLNYAVPPLTSGKPKIVQVNLGTKQTKVDSKSFIYFTTSGDLPPTDPFEAELVIEMSRMFLYDMRIYHISDTGAKRLLGKVPSLPKKLTITAKTKVLIIDTVPPAIAYKETIPANGQLFGLTGRALTSPANIKFQVTDNDPWDGMNGITPHTKYAAGNIGTNKGIISTNYNKPGSAQYNLKPVFNQINQGVQLSYTIASITAARKITIGKASTMPSFGHFGSGLSDPTKSYIKNVDNTFTAKWDFIVPLSTLDNGKAIQIPKNYANNTPGYEPYKFWISMRDSSGNETLDSLMNLAIHVKDDIPPDPYGIIYELKNKGTARFPTSATIPENDQFARNFESATAFNQTFVSRGSWVPSAPGSLLDGQIIDSGNTGLKALWPVDDSKIAALPEAMRTSAIPPGSIQVEDNVEVLMQVGAGDNAGAATAKLTFRNFDINGTEQALSTGLSSFSLPGANNSLETSVPAMLRTIFREGKAIKFPYAVPILIEASDNAKDWDSYLSAGVNGVGLWNWGTLSDGKSVPNKRSFKTTLPVYGSALTIRTIEYGQRNPK